MASKKRGRPKGSKNKKTSKKVSVTSTTKRRKKAAVIAVPALMSEEFILLNKIDRTVHNIDVTVNADKWRARKAKKARRQHRLSSAFDKAEREGITAE